MTMSKETSEWDERAAVPISVLDELALQAGPDGRVVIVCPGGRGLWAQVQRGDGVPVDVPRYLGRRA